MFKVILFIFLFIVDMEAQEDKNKIEVTANSLHTTKDTIEAKSGVIVYYNNSIIKAKHALYDKKTKLLTLDGNVETIGYKGAKERTSHMVLNTETKEVTFDKLFLTSKNDVWLLSNKANKKEKIYTFNESIISSCEVNKPLWYMKFSSSTYDTETYYMKMYNTKVYLLDVPIFYTPFLAFSTRKERTSGLLFPALSYSENEGYMLDQPLFWAISSNMDLETNFQVRTRRASGIYSTFRFVDSNHSSGKIRMGYFKDKNSYAIENNLNDSSHYGFEFNYESESIFKSYLPSSYKDELYVNTTFLNDIDYINLQNNRLRHFGLNPLQESRLNYFIVDTNNYYGVNAKYFIDTRLKDNDTTIQIMPALQWHKYLTHIISNKLTYSVDTHINNLYRKEGVNLQQVEVKIPLEFTTSFFNDYMKLSLSEELFYSKNIFSNDIFLNNNYQYFSSTSKVKIFTDLVKKYENYMHVIQPAIEYISPENENESPVTFDDLDDNQRELFSVGLPEEQYRIGLQQYIYDNDLKLTFYQRLSQIYYPDRINKWQDLNNEMSYHFNKWSFYNNILYSHEFGDIREMASSISLKESTYNFSIGHSFTQELVKHKNNSILVNSIDFRFGYTYNDHISLNGALNYDIEKASSTQWRIGGDYHQDCWSFGGFMRQDITPRPTGSTKENSFGFQLNFIPFGGIDSTMLNDVMDND